MYFDEEKLHLWLKDNIQAIDFIKLMASIAHAWDDLVDQDHYIGSETINRLFIDTLIELPRNTFYTENFERLHAILCNSITNWQIANKFENDGSVYEKSIAFILRSSYVDLITQSASLVGGYEWGRQVGEEVRLLTHGETFEGYLLGLEKEQAARNEGIEQPPIPADAVRVISREEKAQRSNRN